MEKKRRKIVRMKIVQEMAGKSKPTIYADVKNGTFPAPIRLGPRAIGFYEDEIEAWQQSRPREWADPVIDG